MATASGKQVSREAPNGHINSYSRGVGRAIAHYGKARVESEDRARMRRRVRYREWESKSGYKMGAKNAR
jgi:hypothetical protein